MADQWTIKVKIQSMDNDAINSKKGTKWKAGDDLTLQIEGHASPGCKMSRWRKQDPCESLAVELPKGLRGFAPIRRSVCRRYNVTVVSNAWPLKKKLDKAATWHKVSPHDADEAENRAFWRDRARRFHVDAHFPVLVTEQLLPGWHAFRPDDEEHDTKQAAMNGIPWMGCGTAGASDSMCGRMPVLHLGDTYKEDLSLLRRHSNGEHAVVKEPLLPVGRASMAQRSCYADLQGAGFSPTNSEARRQEIAERKLRGATFIKELERRYAHRRDCFRKAQMDAREAQKKSEVPHWRRVEETVNMLKQRIALIVMAHPKYQSISFGGSEPLDEVTKLEDVEGMANGKTMDLVVAVPPEPEAPPVEISDD
ncbi:Retrovirus-related Pol polyprotein from transposon TNT 1-94, partial [Durusdinium trenchii]